MKRYVPVFAAVFACVTFATMSEARADTYLGLDAGVAVPIPESFAVEPKTGPSVSLRLGYRLPVPVLYVSGEILGSWQNFPQDEAPQRVLSGRAGIRAGFDAAIAVKLFGHIGYSNLAGEGSDFVVEADGLSWDAGLALDFTLLPVIDFGVHGAYVTLMNDNGDINWVEAGVHAELSF
jgi:hypothetical protein